MSTFEDTADGRTKLVGVIGSGLIGRDPFDRRAWSTSSYFFFTALRNRGVLQRAFGVEVPALRRYLLMAKNFHPNRSVWRKHFYSDTAYREALTEQVQKSMQPDDLACDFLQIGHMYDVPRLLAGRTRCFSYHDGNLVTSIHSPYTPAGLNAHHIDRALSFEKRVSHGTTLIFTMSEYLRQSFVRDYGMPPDRVVSIGAGVNLDTIPPVGPDKRYDTQEILFIGVEFARKGGWELLRAFQGVRRRLVHAKLHVVGPKQLTIPLALQGGVTYHGYLSKTDRSGRAQLDALFARCSLFVMPSLYEPFGVAPLEAMLHGLPCVLTNAWALKEMVTPGENGDLVEPRNVENLEAKLVTLLADADRLHRMGETGRQAVLERFTWERVVDRLIRTMAAAKSCSA